MNQTATLTAQDWRARATALAINGHAFIDGRYVDAASGETFDDVTPIDGRVIARVASTDKADVERAVAAARRAFDSGVWSRQPPRERKRVLQRFAELILAHRDQLALITRDPIGVVAAIVPWNFPLIMAAWKIGPALAAGNSFILKPSEKSPLSAIRLAALAAEAGIPDGVFNVLPGYGHTAGQALALHMDVDCIGFTGSTRTGKLMLQYSGQSNMKRVWLECGGKSPNIILADCPDLDRAAATAAGAIFFNQGEMCTAASRLLIEESVRDRVLEKVVEASRAMQPGDPLDPTTRMGAIVDEIQTRTVLGYIDSGRSEGAAVLTGGQRVLEQTGGCYIGPTVFANVKTDMRIAREEIFGPVLAAITVKDAEEAVRVGNGVEYGLAADITVPFGGFKQSGTGRDKSLHAFDKYTELKTTWIDLSQ